MKNIYWLFTAILINLCISPGCCDIEKKLLGEEIANDHDPLEFLPFKVAIPKHFVLHQIEGNDWLLLGEKNALQDLDNQFVKNPDATIFPTSGIIRMKLSCNSSQAEIFSGNDDELKNEIKKMGGTKFCIRELTWGAYPLKIVEATVRGAPFRMGWIGLNCGGPVMCINYMFPQDKESHQHDFAIWNRFLSETKERPQEELEAFYQRETLSQNQIGAE